MESLARMWHEGNTRGNAALMARAAHALRVQPFADVTQFMLRQAMLPKAAADRARSAGEDLPDRLFFEDSLVVRDACALLDGEALATADLDHE